MQIGDAVVALATVGIWLFCLLDLITTPALLIRHLRKGWWVLLLVLFGALGAAGWLLFGRPRRLPTEWVEVGPDDDPEFLAGIRVQRSEEQQLLDWWEADLRRPGSGDDRPNGDSTNGRHHEG